MNESSAVAGENDLVLIHLAWSPANGPYDPVNNYAGWHLMLKIEPAPTWDPYVGQYVGAARIYTSSNKSGLQPFVNTYNGPAIDWIAGTSPSLLYVEARTVGQFSLKLELSRPNNSPVDADLVVFTAVQRPDIDPRHRLRQHGDD